jgi:C1A family cysteine protease
LERSIRQAVNVTVQEFPTANISTKWNWNDMGMVSPIKNERNCGASYIFASVGAIESRLSIKVNKTLNSMSSQMFLNCLNTDAPWRTDKCQGGTEVEVF